MTTTNQEKVKISVSPRSEYAGNQALFDALEAILPVSFQGCDLTEIADRSAAILVGTNSEQTQQTAARGIRCYRVSSRNGSGIPSEGRIEFSSSLAVHPAFRGAKAHDPSLTSIAPLTLAGENLASIDGRSAWTVRQSGAGCIHDVAVDLPVLDSKECFRQHFLVARWFKLLPLLNFLRAECNSVRWSRPETEACFIIDDPNLHSTRYGYVDFQALAVHARTHHYHAAIATVPLDTWHVNSKAASIFRENAEQLSILIHGVNHTKNELASSNGLPEMQRLLRMGLERIRDFEQRSGLPVCKVMVPPHGALSIDVANCMAGLGYEAACVSYGSLLHWNRNAQWPAHFGFALGQFLGPSNFPVFHRTTLNEVDIRLCIFLEQPVVMTSHHQDLSSEMQKFAALALLVNSFGPTGWKSPSAISRSNYLARKQNSTLHVMPYSRWIRLKIPGDVSQLSLRLPWSSVPIVLEQGDEGLFRNLQRESAPLVELLESTPGTLELAFPYTMRDPVRVTRADNPGMWPVLRRVLTESRDRLFPMLHAGN